MLQSTQENVLGPEHPDVASVVFNRAVLLQLQVGISTFLLFPESVHVGKGFGRFHVFCCMTETWSLLHVEHPQGRYAEAVQIWTRAVSTRQMKLGDSHPDTVTAKKNLENALNQVRRLKLLCVRLTDTAHE